MTDVLDVPAPIGHNNPPLTPYEAIKAHCDDLLTEAHNWADGAVVENQEQDDEVSRLIADLTDALKAADEARKVENKPFDDGKAEVQERYNVYIAPATNKTPGKITQAVAALKATLKPYRDRLAAEKAAIAAAAAAEAKRIADEAAAARAAASDADLGAIEAAELLTAQAEQAAKEATAASKDKVAGLRKTYTPVITDQKAAILHYMKDQPGEFVALVQRLAEIDVRAGKRQIPGITVEEGTRL